MRLRIKEWMELRNVSQAQIAASLGVARATVSAWVEGRPGKDGKRIMVFPDADGFEALCLFLECTPSDLLELQKRKTPSGLIWRDFRGPRDRGERRAREAGRAALAKLEALDADMSATWGHVEEMGTVQEMLDRDRGEP